MTDITLKIAVFELSRFDNGELVVEELQFQVGVGPPAIFIPSEEEHFVWNGRRYECYRRVMNFDKALLTVKAREIR